MKQHFLPLAGLFIGTFAFESQAQTSSLWQDVQTQNGLRKSVRSDYIQHRKIQASMDQLRYELGTAPAEKNAQSAIEIDLPLPDGSFVKYKIVKSPIMAEALAKQFPELTTYKGFEVNNPANTGRFDLSPSGFHGMISQNGQVVYIDPVLHESDNHISYFKQDFQPYARKGKSKPRFSCGVKNTGNNQKLRLAKSSVSHKRPAANDGKLRTYRIAVAATAEYSNFQHELLKGANAKASAMSSISTAINRVNQIYNNDLSVKLILAAGSEKIVFTNTSTDPYEDTPEANNYDPAGLMIEKNTPAIDKAIGNNNYDIGHLFSINGGGLAGLGSVCEDGGKGAGVTGSDNPRGDSYWVDYVAHEIGHQFGADHSFNGSAESCTTRATEFAYEPGSGSTIMGYAGICGDENLQDNSDPYFHTNSLDQIYAFIHSAGTCAQITPNNNLNPVVNAGKNYTIPAKTPFVLTGQASDANSRDALTYTWEQLDLGATTSSKETFTDNGSRPIFRSFMPTSNPARTFPQMADVLSGQTTYGETLPTTTRDLNFRLTVRDGKGGLSSDNTVLKVQSSAGPFKVTAPATKTTWNGNSQQSITWDVANTQTAPISCSHVDISFSFDGGKNFSAAVLKATANDGNAVIRVPNPESSTATGRIKIACSNNIFFALGAKDISINKNASGTTTPTTAPTTLSLTAKDAILKEGNGGTSNFTFSVTRQGSLETASSVQYRVTAGITNPVNAEDFAGTLPSGTVSFSPGQSSKVINIQVSGDTSVEKNESFILTLSEATGATLISTTAQGSIQNDDVSTAAPTSTPTTPAIATPKKETGSSSGSIDLWWLGILLPILTLGKRKKCN